MKKDLAGQLGFWSSVYVSILGVIYLLVLIFYTVSEGFVVPPPPFVQLAAGLITFLTVPGLVVLFTAIRFVQEQANQALGSLGVSFMLLFAATVGINRFVQLTVIQQSLPDVPTDLVRFIPGKEFKARLKNFSFEKNSADQ